VEPQKYGDWNDRLPATVGSLFFHTANWARVLEETYRYKPLYFIEESGTRPTGLMPVMEVNSPLTGRRGVSLPFSDYCPLIERDAPWAGQGLDQVLAYGRKARWNYFEWRGRRNGGSAHRPSASYYRHVLPLDQEDKLFSHLHDANRRNIKKALREKIQVAFYRSPEAMAAFYRLNAMTRREHGLPPQPYLFFKKIQEHVVAKGMGFVALAYHQDRAIAGAVYFHFRKEALYKYGASDAAFQQLRANNLLMWEAIQWFSQQGFQSLCFGRTDLHHEGLRRFKLGWGALETTLDYYRYNFKQEAFVEARSKVSGIHTLVFGKLPEPLLRIVGTVLYKHMG